jgi:ribonuclease P protein subunit POP4
MKRRELIGRNIEVTNSKNKSNIGLKGKIIDETKNMLKIRTKQGEKRLIKNNITFTIKMEGKNIEIRGAEIQTAPEERIKLR